MHKGGSIAADAGFTIAEVLIVLAVTGLLFVSAAILISGRQNKTMFMSAVNDFRQQLQQVINQTQSGYYSGHDFGCRGMSSGTPAISLTPNNDGTCIFLGSNVQFNPGDGQFMVIPVVGNRLSGDKEVTSLTQAAPLAVTNDMVPGAAQINTLEYGMTIVTATPSTLGIFSDLASYADSSTCASADCLKSGSRAFGLYNARVMTPASSITSVNSPPTVCVKSGTTNQSAKLTISGEGVTSQVFGGGAC